MAETADPSVPFSDQLEEWLSSDDEKTLGRLTEVFAEKSFAVLIMILMFLPALPVPTGGVTNLFEIVALVVALQLVLGLRAVWLPRSWARRPLGDAVTDRGLPFILRRVRWFERFARPRFDRLIGSRAALRVLGVVLVAFVVSSAVAPPFSGLDTLPALGAVVVSLGIILEDVIVGGIGSTIGVAGAALLLVLGATAVRVVGEVF